MLLAAVAERAECLLERSGARLLEPGEACIVALGPVLLLKHCSLLHQDFAAGDEVALERAVVVEVKRDRAQGSDQHDHLRRAHEAAEPADRANIAEGHPALDPCVAQRGRVVHESDRYEHRQKL